MNKEQVLQWLNELSLKQKVMIPLSVAVIFYGLATRQGQAWEPIAKQVFQPTLSTVAVADNSTLPTESKAIVELNNQQSAIILGLATEFKISAIAFKNDSTHKCSKLIALTDCLNTFLDDRLATLTSLALDPLPNRQNLTVNGTNTLEVTALMLAIAQSIPASERNALQNALIAQYPETAKFRPATLAETLSQLNNENRLVAVKEREKLEGQQAALTADKCAGLTPQQQQEVKECNL